MVETTELGFSIEKMFGQLQSQLSTMSSMLQAQNRDLSAKNAQLEARVEDLTAEIAEFRTGIEMRSENVDAIKKSKKTAVSDAINIDGVEYIPNYRKYFGNLERYLRDNELTNRKLEKTPDIKFADVIRGCERWVDERDMDGGETQ